MLGQGLCRIIMHVDMDCFFASVAVRHRPELQRIPLAVAHSNHSAGHSEISCVNYVARRCGVRADMWMASARERCVHPAQATFPSSGTAHVPANSTLAPQSIASVYLAVCQSHALLNCQMRSVFSLVLAGR